MSYIVDFYISCPKCFSYEQTPYHVSITMIQTPESPGPFFTYPSGCGGYRNCLTCNWCLKTLREMFICGKISFYQDPRSIYGTYHQTLSQPIRPQPEETASNSPESS